MSSNNFLIDANSFITPYLTYYPFDFAPSFWTQMEQAINDGTIVILDMVKSEILQGNDALREWMANLDIGAYIDHREPGILERYGAILRYIQENPCYKSSALAEWSRGSVADPWLIATAAAYNHRERPKNCVPAQSGANRAEI
ncbi:MAG: DUF4411 family protein [Lachnospiraceae bacterium]|nr:DUF4411 family protein [Lachnospiraceae bacterium]